MVDSERTSDQSSNPQAAESDPPVSPATKPSAADQKAEIPKSGGFLSPSVRSKIFAAALILVILWEIGLLNLAASFASSLISAPGPPKVNKVFEIVVPTESHMLEAGSGAANFQFANTAKGSVTIRGVQVFNAISGQICKVTTKFPIELQPEETFNISAAGCASSKVTPGRGYIAGISINGTTKVKYLLLASQNIFVPIASLNLSEDEARKSRKRPTSGEEGTSARTRAAASAKGSPERKTIR